MAPLVALALAMAASTAYSQVSSFAWWTDLILRSGALSVIYAGTLWLIEREAIAADWRQLRQVLRREEEG